jgi:hypothetical protein
LEERRGRGKETRGRNREKETEGERYNGTNMRER